MYGAVSKVKHFQDFGVKFNAIKPGSSKFGIAIVDSFKIFPHFFRDEHIVSILDDILVENLLVVSFENLVVDFCWFLPDIAVDKIKVFQFLWHGVLKFIIILNHVIRFFFDIMKFEFSQRQGIGNFFLLLAAVGTE